MAECFICGKRVSSPVEHTVRVSFGRLKGERIRKDTKLTFCSKRCLKAYLLLEHIVMGYDVVSAVEHLREYHGFDKEDERLVLEWFNSLPDNVLDELMYKVMSVIGFREFVLVPSPVPADVIKRDEKRLKAYRRFWREAIEEVFGIKLDEDPDITIL